MPVSWSIEGDQVRMNLDGRYKPSDVTEQFLAVLADPRCPEQFSLLVDATKTESLGERSPAEIRQVAEFLGPYRERVRGRCAVVVASDLHFGLSRMGSAFSDNVGVDAQVFRSVGEAQTWLRERDT